MKGMTNNQIIMNEAAKLDRKEQWRDKKRECRNE